MRIWPKCCGRLDLPPNKHTEARSLIMRTFERMIA
nr:MAG TPA: hypothetical protein [Caudoviricetes sp.]